MFLVIACVVIVVLWKRMGGPAFTFSTKGWLQLLFSRTAPKGFTPRGTVDALHILAVWPPSCHHARLQTAVF